MNPASILTLCRINAAVIFYYFQASTNNYCYCAAQQISEVKDENLYRIMLLCYRS